MMKITAILFLIVIGCMLAAGLSCNSCGRECMPACGTRRFRSCCFNYLRRKRGQETLQISSENLLKPDIYQVEDSELWGFAPSDSELYHNKDTADTQLQNMYV